MPLRTLVSPRALLTTLALCAVVAGSFAPAGAHPYVATDGYVGTWRGAEASSYVYDDATGEETWVYAHGVQERYAGLTAGPPSANAFFHLHVDNCRPPADPNEYWDYYCTSRTFTGQGDTLVIDPALRTASFAGTLRDEDGEPCDVTAEWVGGDLDHDYNGWAYTSRHVTDANAGADLWRPAQTSFSATCLPDVALEDGAVWTNAGTGAYLEVE